MWLDFFFILFYRMFTFFTLFTCRRAYEQYNITCADFRGEVNFSLLLIVFVRSRTHPLFPPSSLPPLSIFWITASVTIGIYCAVQRRYNPNQLTEIRDFSQKIRWFSFLPAPGLGVHCTTPYPTSSAAIWCHHPSEASDFRRIPWLTELP